MMQEATPVAAPSAAPASAPAGSQPTGGFAQLLKGRQSSPAAERPAAQSSSSAATTPHRQAATQPATPAAQEKKPSTGEKQGGVAEAAAQNTAPAAGKAKSGGAKPNAGIPWRDLMGKSLAAGAEQTPVAAGQAQGAVTPGAAKGESAASAGDQGGAVKRPTQQAQAQPNGTAGMAGTASPPILAAVAQLPTAANWQPAMTAATPATPAAATVATVATVATPEVAAVAALQPARGITSQPATAAAGTQSQQGISLLDVEPAAGPVQLGQNDAQLTALEGLIQQEVAGKTLTVPTPGIAPEGKGATPAAQGAAVDTTQPAGKTQQAQQAAGQQTAGGGSAGQRQDGGVSAPVVKGGAEGAPATWLTGTASQASARGEEQTPKLAGEAATKEASASVQQGETPAKATTVQQQPVQAQNGPAAQSSASAPVADAAPWQAANQTPDGNQLPDKGVLSAYGLDLRTAEKGPAGVLAQNGGGDQTVVTPKKAIEDAFGTKAATVAEAKLSSLSASQGGNGSGEAGGKGEKEQGKEAEQFLTSGLGIHNLPGADASQPEAKQATTQSALHESILSQVKDGVVTHDGKGSSEISIKLNPNDLGALKIQISMDDNSRVRVEVQADNKMVKDLLMSNLDSLKEALSSKNFTMDGFQVSTGGGGFNSPLPEHRDQSQQQPAHRSAGGASYADPEEGTVNYMTADVNSLLSVRL